MSTHQEPCIVCHVHDGDPTRHYWTLASDGRDVYVCRGCLSKTLARGLAVMAFTDTDKSHWATR